MFADTGNGPVTPMWMGDLWPVIAIVTICAAALALVTGYSLLTRRPWGRTLAIIVSILALVKFSIFGAALGIYNVVGTCSGGVGARV